MRVEPFLQVVLVLVLGSLVFEYVWEFAGFFMIVGLHRCMRWWGSTWDTERVPVQAVLVGDVGGRPGEVEA